jgi:hypothetical protein
MKFDLDDKAVLKIGAVTAAAFGSHAFFAPENLQETYFEASTPRSNIAAQWLGNGLLSCAACNYTVAVSDETAPKTVKNLLKTNGVLWSLAAGQTLYNAENGWQKKDVAYTAAAVQAGIAALSLWRGYADADEE